WRLRSMRDHHGRADGNALVEVGDVVVQHPNAAIRDKAADRTRRVGAVDGIFSAGQRHRRYAHRIARRTAGDHAWHRWLVAPDLRGRRPGRMTVLAVDLGDAGPLLARFADTDRVADGLAVI